MGFWEFVRSVNEHAEKQAVELEREVTRASRKYERYDDRRLVETYRNASGIERTACAMEIKRRRSRDDE